MDNIFDSKKYNILALKNSDSYKKNNPFPHIQFKNFLKPFIPPRGFLNICSLVGALYPWTPNKGTFYTEFIMSCKVTRLAILASEFLPPRTAEWNL